MTSSQKGKNWTILTVINIQKMHNFKRNCTDHVLLSNVGKDPRNNRIHTKSICNNTDGTYLLELNKPCYLD
jgi:hypothetical protein